MTFPQYPTAGASPTAGGYGPMQTPAPQYDSRGHLGKVHLASWPYRMASGLIDYGIPWMAYAITRNTSIGTVAFILIMLNSGLLQGSTSQSVGKRIVGIRLATGVMVGSQHLLVYPGIIRSALRTLLHALDFIAFIGFLRPIWQREYKTWADSIAQTVVLARDSGNLVLNQRPRGAPTSSNF